MVADVPSQGDLGFDTAYMSQPQATDPQNASAAWISTPTRRAPQTTHASAADDAAQWRVWQWEDGEARDVAATSGGYSRTAIDPEVFACCICMDTLQGPIMPLCMHVFCYSCLHEWLKQGNTNCPVCRARVEEKPMRDDIFEDELAKAIENGVVAAPTPNASRRRYDWSGTIFA
ncbi:hypothetical protein K438DRAFT_1032390 [Mycena galopus ATCC 62051]|nr:hypothetical protein K438DRAFT_1032390 [Mycena galopus ATCC 62051]